MSRLSDLINGTTDTASQPYRIFAVAPDNKSVIVVCDQYREMWEVAEYVKSQRSGAWMAGFWKNQGYIGGDNPYKFAGTWKYLLVQA